MNGAETLILASAGAGMEVCFANPGTSEMAMVDALRRNKAMRPVLVLFEGVASGAADGYSRISGKVAGVMLHLGPGLANATANLHAARSRRSSTGWAITRPGYSRTIRRWLRTSTRSRAEARNG